jgi:GrpB-like predicted nucleotidyltransferase (UPF0157 family)/GNAT superfamily N-acetyltransferase
MDSSEKMARIVVVDYDPAWPATFESLRTKVWAAVHDVAMSIEHVGSTSVPGLAAKPIIDMTVIVPSAADIARTIERLTTIGYLYRGNLGIEGREAFHNPPQSPAHHLYVCPAGSLGLLNPLEFRDYLRLHPDVAQAYGELKKMLAHRFPNDIDSYSDGKTTMIVGILKELGFSTNQLESIERANRKPPQLAASCTIRRLGVEDAEAWAALRLEALTNHPLAFGASPPDTLEQLANSVRTRLERDEESAILGAFDGSSMIGIVGVVRETSKKEQHKSRIWGMYVTGSRRRSGVGALLLKAAIAQARHWQGVIQAGLSVTDAADGARRLYERYGFQAWGREPRAIYANGQYADETYMTLDLEQAPSDEDETGAIA